MCHYSKTLGMLQWKGSFRRCIRVLIFLVVVDEFNLRGNELTVVHRDLLEEFSGEVFNMLFDRLYMEVFIEYFITNKPWGVSHDSEDFILECLNFLVMRLCYDAPDLG
ncbi:hypothetical protein AVEN_177487-1 [Araneus ventricosus]|uniref:Uncharacterized protein n=1 Tax=Araneus ventricosus TaxID=182803 RepID=A0A4Y2D2N7_ARAVE|nr:hypothetical protein AVEN_177487-1 [Araneus ventricosus]